MKFAELAAPGRYPFRLRIIVDREEDRLFREAADLGVNAERCYPDDLDLDEVELRWPADRVEILGHARQIGHGYFVA